jgi:hypothetical protein
MADERQDAFCWEGATAKAADAPSPLVIAPAPARRGRAWLGAGAVIVAGAVAAALVLSGGGGGAPQTVLARAADVTTHVPGYRFAMTMNVSVAGQNIALSANGRFNTRPLSGTMTMAVAGHQITELVVPPHVYMQIPSASSAWQRISVGALNSSPAGSSVDIQQTISFLRTVGTVTTIGPDVTGGVPTTHYRAVVDINRLAAALPLPRSSSTTTGLSGLEQSLGGSGLPLDVWLDAQSRVRQLTMSMAAASASFTMTMQFSDYGPQAPVSAPPAGEVQDLGSASSPALSG